MIANVYLPSPMSIDSVCKPQTLGVAGEHPVEVARPQAGLVAAGAALDFDDHVLLVVGVALDHRQADLLLELLDALRARDREHLAQLGILARPRRAAPPRRPRRRARAAIRVASFAAGSSWL